MDFCGLLWTTVDFYLPSLPNFPSILIPRWKFQRSVGWGTTVIDCLCLLLLLFSFLFRKTSGIREHGPSSNGLEQQVARVTDWRQNWSLSSVMGVICPLDWNRVNVLVKIDGRGGDRHPCPPRSDGPEQQVARVTDWRQSNQPRRWQSRALNVSRGEIPQRQTRDLRRKKFCILLIWWWKTTALRVSLFFFEEPKCATNYCGKHNYVENSQHNGQVWFKFYR